MASNINNNTIRENGNNKRHVNLTMDDVPNGTINDTINLLLRAGNRTDLDKLLFFVQSPGLIGGDDFLQWASDADPTAVVALQRYHRRLQDGDRNTPILTTPNDNQLNINMATLAECYGEMIHGDSTYFISNMEHLHEFLSLVDRGANGGICGDDMTLISYTGRTIDVQGIDNHELPQLKLCSCGGVVRTQRGPAILIFNQYAFHGRGKSIHSSLQLEDQFTLGNSNVYKLSCSFVAFKNKLAIKR